MTTMLTVFRAPATGQALVMKKAATIAEYHGMHNLAGLIDMATEAMGDHGSSWCLRIFNLTIFVCRS